MKYKWLSKLISNGSSKNRVMPPTAKTILNVIYLNVLNSENKYIMIESSIKKSEFINSGHIIEEYRVVYK